MRLTPFLAAAVLVAGCGSGDDKKDTTARKPARGGAATVSMKNIKYVPQDLEIKRVRGSPGPTTVCTIHPGQAGTITVTG